MSFYSIGSVGVAGLLVAACAFWTKEKYNSTSRVCLIGAGVTAGMLLVCAAFDRSNYLMVGGQRRIRLSAVEPTAPIAAAFNSTLVERASPY